MSTKVRNEMNAAATQTMLSTELALLVAVKQFAVSIEEKLTTTVNQLIARYRKAMNDAAAKELERERLQSEFYRRNFHLLGSRF